jgi:hypothetical protein
MVQTVVLSCTFIAGKVPGCIFLKCLGERFGRTLLFKTFLRMITFFCVIFLMAFRRIGADKMVNILKLA